VRDAYNITRNQFTSFDFFLFAISNDNCFHGNVTFKRRDDIGRLFFLIPTDSGVKHKDTDNDTEVDPVSQASREKDSNFHDWRPNQSNDAMILVS
jgi:hypothetical protein